MARSKKGRKKGNVISVDLSNVESLGRVSDGDHVAEVISIEQKDSGEGNPYLNWKMKAGGGIVYHTTSLQPQALWNLRRTLEACGYEVPDDEFDIDLDALVGTELGISVEGEVYQGKRKPVVVEVFLADEVEESDEEEPEEPEEEEEEEPESKKKSKKKSSKKGKKKSLKKGAKVSWEDGEDTYEGVVTDIDGDVITVEDEDDDEWEIDKDEITLI